MTTYNLKYSIRDIDQMNLIRTLREANKADHELPKTSADLEKWVKFFETKYEAQMASTNDFGR